MGIPVSGSYKLNVIKLSNTGHGVSNGVAYYQLGEYGNTITNNTNVSFSGNRVSFYDSTGSYVSINYSMAAGQVNYKYNSVIIKDPLTGDWYILSGEPAKNYAPGMTVTHGTTGASNIFDSSNWNFGDRTWNPSYSTGGFTASVPACFLQGTLIATPRGEVEVEQLRVGDEVVVISDGMRKAAPIRWVGKAQCVVRQDLEDDLSGYPVCVRANAFSDGVPSSDLHVTAEHCFLFGGFLSPIRLFVNNRSIFYDKKTTSYDYYHVETDGHSVIIANGALSESYKDDGSRYLFDDGVVTLAQIGQRNANAILSIVEVRSDVAHLEPHFRALDDRARSMGIAEVNDNGTYTLTSEHDVHLVMKDGTAIFPSRVQSGRYIFSITSQYKDLLIVSRSSRPFDTIGPYYDDRRKLGILIDEVVVWGGGGTRDITAGLGFEAACGWHERATDDSAIWTNGCAELCLGEVENDAPVVVSIHVIGGGPYLNHDLVEKKQSRAA